MITLNEALGDAQRKRIAIGHFNVSDLVALKAVTGAARALKVPVLIGTSEGERDFIGVGETVAVVASLREELDQPIFVNADHTHSLERAVEAAKAGYDMVARSCHLLRVAHLPYQPFFRDGSRHHSAAHARLHHQPMDPWRHA
jgi:fructose/tagatose bisphosphate aldolase